MDVQVQLVKHLLEAYTEDKPFKLSENADSVIRGVIHKEGHCPCIISERVPCPCPNHKKEIEEKGRCHCGLFVSREKQDG